TLGFGVVVKDTSVKTVDARRSRQYGRQSDFGVLLPCSFPKNPGPYCSAWKQGRLVSPVRDIGLPLDRSAKSEAGDEFSQPLGLFFLACRGSCRMPDLSNGIPGDFIQFGDS